MSAKHEHDNSPSDAGDLSRRDFVAVSVATGVAVTALPGGGDSRRAARRREERHDQHARRQLQRRLLPPRRGQAPGRAAVDGRVRPAPFDARHGPAPGRRRLRRAGAQPVLPRRQGAVLRDRHQRRLQGQGHVRQDRAVDGLDRRAPAPRRSDAIEFVKFLDAQPEVDKGKKIGTQGYCMGGALVLRTAAAVPETRRRRRVVPTAAAWSPTSPIRPTRSRRRSRRSC